MIISMHQRYSWIESSKGGALVTPPSQNRDVSPPFSLVDKSVEKSAEKSAEKLAKKSDDKLAAKFSIETALTYFRDLPENPHDSEELSNSSDFCQLSNRGGIY